MKKINWKKIAGNIPSEVKIGKTCYQIVWQKDITDTKGNYLYGLTDLNSKIITIRMDMPARLTVETLLHELIHAYDEEHKVGLTETQVLKLEHLAPILVKLNLFKL